MGFFNFIFGRNKNKKRELPSVFRSIPKVEETRIFSKEETQALKQLAQQRSKDKDNSVEAYQALTSIDNDETQIALSHFKYLDALTGNEAQQAIAGSKSIRKEVRVNKRIDLIRERLRGYK